MKTILIVACAVLSSLSFLQPAHEGKKAKSNAEVYVSLSLDEISEMNESDLKTHIQDKMPWHLDNKCSLTVTFSNMTKIDGELKEAKVYVSDACENLDSITKAVLQLINTNN